MSAKICCINKTTLGTPPSIIPPKMKEIDNKIIFNLLFNFWLRNRMTANRPTEIRITNDKITSITIFL
jgi:hypothetical protein